MREMVKEKDAAERLGVATGTLRNWRWAKIGPRYFKVGKSVRYCVADLESYINRSAVIPSVLALLEEKRGSL